MLSLAELDDQGGNTEKAHRNLTASSSQQWSPKSRFAPQTLWAHPTWPFPEPQKNYKLSETGQAALCSHSFAWLCGTHWCSHPARAGTGLTCASIAQILETRCCGVSFAAKGAWLSLPHPQKVNSPVCTSRSICPVWACSTDHSALCSCQLKSCFLHQTPSAFSVVFLPLTKADVTHKVL